MSSAHYRRQTGTEHRLPQRLRHRRHRERRRVQLVRLHSRRRDPGIRDFLSGPDRPDHRTGPAPGPAGRTWPAVVRGRARRDGGGCYAVGRVRHVAGGAAAPPVAGPADGGAGRAAHAGVTGCGAVVRGDAARGATSEGRPGADGRWFRPSRAATVEIMTVSEDFSDAVSLTTMRDLWEHRRHHREAGSPPPVAGGQVDLAGRGTAAGAGVRGRPRLRRLWIDSFDGPVVGSRRRDGPSAPARMGARTAPADPWTRS